MPLEKVVETDVLVIGGGMAGCFAAIKAKNKGVKVTLVDKGYVSKSGQTPFAGGFLVFNPEWGHDLDSWMNQINNYGEYLNNREWTKIILKDSYSRYKDLISWGVEFFKIEMPQSKSSYPKRVTEAVCIKENTHAGILRNQVVKSGVEILDRIMITDLIEQDRKIVGAIGFPTDNLDFYLFKTKAICLCAGSGGFKPHGAWPIANLTSDGHSMAYRVGVEITGKEFEDYHGHSSNSRLQLPGSKSPRIPPRIGLWGEVPPGHMKGQLFNSEGKEIIIREDLTPVFEAHEGYWPFRDEKGNKIRSVNGAAPGLAIHTAEGILPSNLDCASSIPGLYAAGDNLATMFVGAFYSVGGGALVNASVTGTRAGIAAAKYAIQTEKIKLDENKLIEMKKSLFRPIERKGGFTPKWVTQLLQNLMIPYFIMYIKNGKRLQATLTLVEFLRDHLVPKLTAKDSHELRLAHETKNMVLNAEMKLRASLFRTESRGTHYREDYPRRVDPDWLTWILLKQENGKMKTIKKPIPKEWWPDLTKPYEKRYFNKFPGE